MAKVFDGYLRVSRVRGREGDSFQSPQQQRDAITAWAASRSVEIAEWHQDLDVSGGVLSRPGLDALLARIRTGETGGIAVARLDPLSRAGVADALRLVEEIAEIGGQVAAVDLGLDPTTPVGEFATTLMLALARMERRRIADTWAESRGNAIRRGVSIAGAQLGYVRTEEGTLAVDPVTAPIVVRAYELAASAGPHAALAYLREHAPERAWPDLGSVRRFLARRAVLGEVRSGELVQTGAHPAIISPSLWTAAQIEPSGRRRAAEEYPLSGVAVCASCGQSMVGGRSGGMVNGERRRTYRCRAGLTRYRGERCSRPASINADALESHVRDQLAVVLADLRVRLGDANADLEPFETALEEAERELEEFAADLTLRRALGDSYAALRDARVAAVDSARDAYQAAARSTVTTTIAAAELDGAGELGSVARAVLASVIVLPGRGNVRARVAVNPL